MAGKIVFCIACFSLFSAVILSAQEINPADSVMHRTQDITTSEMRLYPLNDLQHILQMKSSIYMIQEYFVQNGVFLSNESYAIDGMSVSGNEYLPEMGYSGLQMNKINSLEYGYSPAGWFDFRTAALPGKQFFKAEFRSNLYGLEENMVFSDKINKYKGDKKPIEIYLSGYAREAKDSGPSFVEKKSMTTPAEEGIQSSPYLSGSFSMPMYSTLFIANDQLETLRYSRNTEQKDLKLYGKLKIPFSDRISVNVQSLYSDSKGKVDEFENRLFNYMNNPDFRRSYFDGKITLNHQLIDKNLLKINYSLSVGYDQARAQQGNDAFGKDFFKYCYIGSYTDIWMPDYFYLQVDGIDTYTQQGTETTRIEFEPGMLNPGLAGYVTWLQGMPVQNPNSLYNYKNGFLPEKINGGWSNYNVPVSTYFQNQNNRFNVNGAINAETDFGALSVGFDYRAEQNRAIEVNTSRLLSSMNYEMNHQLQQFDTDHPIQEKVDGKVYIKYDRLYDEKQQTAFDRNLRTRLGLPVDGTEFILVDSYDYNTQTIKYYDKKTQLQTLKVDGDPFSTDLFSPMELLGIVNSFGYDVYGKKIKSSHDAFSLLQDGAQIPYSPTNTAVWLKYKKDLSWLKINGGLRIERFDARQPVLIDPLSFYRINTVAETPELNHSSAAHPDWLVYLAQYGSANVIAYRQGSQWYTPDGSIAPYDYMSGKMIRPSLAANQEAGLQRNAFTQYKPVINFLPAIDLTFNLNKKTVATIQFNSFTRNPYANRFSAYEYYQHSVFSLTSIENPALRPERFDNLTAGIGYFGSTGLSAWLSGEMLWYKDAIQPSYVAYVYPMNYYTYENRSKTIQIPSMDLKVNYNRYWWDGGFNVTHHFISDKISKADAVDKYGINVYESTSLDLITGYAALKFHHSLEGFSISGIARHRGGTTYLLMNEFIQTGNTGRMKPSDDLDLKLLYSLKVFNKEMQLDFYFQVLNTLNSKTLYYVYPNTGKPDDDGYLTSPEYQNQINSSVDPEALRAQYAIAMNNPAFYGQPRSFWIGVSVVF